MSRAWAPRRPCRPANVRGQAYDPRGSGREALSDPDSRGPRRRSPPRDRTPMAARGMLCATAERLTPMLEACVLLGVITNRVKTGSLELTATCITTARRSRRSNGPDPMPVLPPTRCVTRDGSRTVAIDACARHVRRSPPRRRLQGEGAEPISPSLCRGLVRVQRYFVNLGSGVLKSVVDGAHPVTTPH